MSAGLASYLVQSETTIRETMACIDRNEGGIALVVDADRKLLGTVTDGDIRRAMLASLDLETEIGTIVQGHRERGRHPVTATTRETPEQLLSLMEQHSVRQIPLLDEEGRVVGISLLDELVKEPALPIRAVVMAGGFGTRLGTLTEATPKPMLPVGDRPLLERIVAQLRDAGIRRVNLTTHYQAEAITKHFGNGDAFGVEINYVNEETPLGTAGSLSLLEHGNEPILVMNGDIVTQIDFAAMHRFHNEHEADLTVALRPYEIRVPYGVIETQAERIVNVQEKPILRSFINAGIYLLAADVSPSVPHQTRYDMPDLIRTLVAEGRCVVGFPLREYWLDIGTAADYEQAIHDAASP